MSFKDRIAVLLEYEGVNKFVSDSQRMGNAGDQNIGKVDDRLNKLGGGMQTAGVGMMAFAGVAVGALGSFARASEGAQAEGRKLDQAIESNSSFAAAGRGPFDDLAASLQNLTGVDGDAVVGMMGFAGTLGLTAEETLKLTPLVVDLAQRYGLDLDAAMRLVNNAAEGNASRLERLIGPMRENEEVAAALARTVGGFAEREAKSFSGQLEILKQNLGDVAEGIGGGVIEAVNNMLGPVQSGVEWFTKLDESTQSQIGSFATYTTVAVGAAGAASFVIGSLIKMRDNFSQARAAVSSFLDARGGLAGVGKWAAAAGIAVGILGALMVKQANDAAEAKARAEEYTAAIREQTGALQANVDAVTAKRLAEDDAVQVARVHGASMRVLADAVGDETSQFGDLEDALFAVQGGFLNGATSGGHMAEILERAGLTGTALGDELLALTESGDMTGAMFLELIRSVGQMEGDFQRGKAAAGDLAAVESDLGIASEDAAAGAGELVDATEELIDVEDAAAEALGGVKDALDGVIDSMSRLHGETLTALEAEAAHNEALDDLSASIVENGLTLDANTAQGRANIAASVDVAKTVTDLMGVRLAETGSVEAARQAGLVYVENLRNQFREAGATEEQVAEYIDTLNLAPEDINTLIQLANGEASAEFVRQYQEQLDALPREKRTEILSMIEMGMYAQAEAALAELTRPRSMSIEPYYTTPANVPPGQRAVQRRARGGPVTAGEPYLVGDRNGITESTELFVPGQSGTVYPLDMTTGTPVGSLGGAAPSIVVNVHVASLIGTKQEVIDGVIDALRRAIWAGAGGDVQRFLGS